MDSGFIYINRPETLAMLCQELSKETEIGMDLECENNLHHYGTYLSLIQISTPSKNWIIDVLELKEIELLLKILRDEKIQKIIHDTSFDLRILNLQFKCDLKNIFDTQLAALFLGKEEIGLGHLLKEYFKIVKEKKFQMADWSKRPLSLKMLNYALSDTQFLLPLRDILTKELQQKNRFAWVKEEFSFIETHQWIYQQGTYHDIKGSGTLNNQQRALLKRLFELRENIAKIADRPNFFIINTTKLLKLVINPPKTISEWEKIKEVHPLIKKHAVEFHAAVEKSKKEEIPLEHPEKKRFSPTQKKIIEKLLKTREKLSKKLKLRPHLLLNQEQIKEVALGKTETLRKWQKEIFKID